jgi:hypothetical protein
MSTLQMKPSALKREYGAHQNMKFLTCALFLWVIFALLDPDPLTLLTMDSIWIRIRNTASKMLKNSVTVHWVFARVFLTV